MDDAALGPRLDLSVPPATGAVETAKAKPDPLTPAIDFTCVTCNRGIGTAAVDQKVRLGALLPHIKHVLVMRAVAVPDSLLD